MKIAEFIPEDGIMLSVRAKDKWAFFKEIAQHLARSIKVPAEEIEKVLVERERLSTTAVGEGIAIPHSRLPGLERLVVLVARAPDGIEFEALDKKPVRLIFVVLAPEEEAQTYLKTLAHVARLLNDPQVKKRLLEARSPEEIREILSEVDYEY